MSPSKSVSKTTYELCSGKMPMLNYMKVWGCVAHVLIFDPGRDKLKLELRDVCLLGMQNIQKDIGYVIQLTKLFWKTDVKFLEDRFDCDENHGEKLNLEEDVDSQPSDISVPSSNQPDIVYQKRKDHPEATRKGTRDHQPSVILSSSDFYTFVGEVDKKIRLNKDHSDPKSSLMLMLIHREWQWKMKSILCTKIKYGALLIYHTGLSLWSESGFSRERKMLKVKWRDIRQD